MRANWPVHMDLWAEHKANAHWERLADITESIMCGLRAEEWFMTCVEPHVKALWRLPLFFSLMCQICKLVQRLDAHWVTSWLNHKHFRTGMLRLETEFENLWAHPESDSTKGLLLYALLFHDSI